ncbi:MAG: alpha/beta hydrolase [Betaproteobacteria bacterium]|nr:alpha/beta hydrolase [Betaproteobacteria bacterium]
MTAAIQSLRPTWFTPAAPPRALLLIAPAMSVRQDFYAPFAEFLRDAGFEVGTFDYRDAGFGARQRPAESNVTLLDWRDDVDAMLGEAERRAAGRPVLYCGHSLGGQLLGLLNRHPSIRAALTVASGTGYWRHNPKMTLRLLYLWFFAMPVYTRAFGYFPGRRLGKVGDLPREIALSWAAWCRHPEYLMGDEAMRAQAAYAAVTAPILSVSFDDDTYVPQPAVEQLHGWFRNAPVDRRHMTPGSAGGKAVGHFGFFKLGRGHALWREAAHWLVAQSESPQPRATAA